MRQIETWCSIYQCCSVDYIFYAERVYFVADGIFD